MTCNLIGFSTRESIAFSLSSHYVTLHTLCIIPNRNVTRFCSTYSSHHVDSSSNNCLNRVERFRHENTSPSLLCLNCSSAGKTWYFSAPQHPYRSYKPHLFSPHFSPDTNMCFDDSSNPSYARSRLEDMSSRDPVHHP